MDFRAIVTNNSPIRFDLCPRHVTHLERARDKPYQITVHRMIVPINILYTILGSYRERAAEFQKIGAYKMV